MALMRPLVLHTLHTLKLPFCLSIRQESCHVFKEVIPWKNAKALADYLSKNVLFKKRGLVVINKPYGICSSFLDNTKQYLNAAPVGERLSLYAALPYLAKNIGCDELFVGYVPERYTSGVTVLATSDMLRKRVKACVQLSRVSNDTMNQYYVVVVGSPNTPSGSFHLGIKMSSKILNQPILVPLSQRSLRNQTMHSVRVDYNTLSSSNLACLMAIKSSSAYLNALRIMCTDKFLSPILGDNMFGARVKRVLGRDILVGFNESTVKKPQKLNPAVLEALELTSGDELIVPTHQHLHEVYLAKFFDVDIILRAPLPPVMQWSCKKLGLEIPECKPHEILNRKEVLRQRAAERTTKAAERTTIKEEQEEDIEIGVSTQ